MYNNPLKPAAPRVALFAAKSKPGPSLGGLIPLF